MDEKLATRFWAKVDKTGGPDACWLWAGTTGDRGYGVFRVGDGTDRAHRLAFVSAGGVIPDGFVVTHSCDNPPCCNPAHLNAETHAENMAQMVARKRQPRSGAKLSPAQVSELRGFYATGGWSQKDLAEAFDLTRGPVSRLLRGVTWR
jgi:hypothetical protein